MNTAEFTPFMWPPMPGLRGRKGGIDRLAACWGYDLGIVLWKMREVISKNPQGPFGPEAIWHTMLNGDKVGIQGVEDAELTRKLVGVRYIYQRRCGDFYWKRGYQVDCIEIGSMRAIEGVIGGTLYRMFLDAGMAEEAFLMGLAA